MRYWTFGGDDRGAYALGRYAPEILEENRYEMLFVVNFYRPLTETASDALEVMREIECRAVCVLPRLSTIQISERKRQQKPFLKTQSKIERLSRHERASRQNDDGALRACSGTD